MAATVAVTGADVVADATRYLGVPYVYGGTSRTSGLDCSGLVLVVCEDLNLTGCPRTSEEQWAWVSHIDQSAAGAGDLVFFVGAEGDPPPGHVGIVVSAGRMIDAPYTGTVVRYDNFATTGATGVMQIIGYGSIPGVTPSASANSSLISGYSPQQAEGGALGAIFGFGLLLVFAAVFLGLIFLLLFIGRGVS